MYYFVLLNFELMNLANFRGGVHGLGGSHGSGGEPFTSQLPGI